LSSCAGIITSSRSSRSAWTSTLLPVGVELEPELGGDHHLFAEGSKGLAHPFREGMCLGVAAVVAT
jgi:hypothetical protein